MEKHPVKVRSSGPYVPNDAIIPHELNFGYLVRTIQDEIADETNDYVEQVQRCVFEALRFCERESFYFNETRDEMFQTRAGEAVYGKADNRHISDSIRISEVYLVLDGSNIGLMKKKIAKAEANEVGQPTSYSYYNKELLLYPTPNDVYTIRMVLTPMRLDEIRNINDYHPWFTDGFDLLKARAKYEFFKNIAHDMEQASIASGDYEEQLQALRRETHSRKGFLRLVPSRM